MCYFRLEDGFGPIAEHMGYSLDQPDFKKVAFAMGITSIEDVPLPKFTLTPDQFFNMLTADGLRNSSYNTKVKQEMEEWFKGNGYEVNRQ